MRSLSLGFTLFVFLVSILNAQMCAMHGGMAPPTSRALPDHGAAQQEVAAICANWGAQPIPVFQQHGIQNAFAARDGYIIYDPAFFNQIVLRFGRSATIIFLAHECGHILRPNVAGANPGVPPQWSEEWKADFFAGQTAFRMGIDPRGFAALLTNFPPSWSHPNSYSRSVAIHQGWVAAGGRPLF